jgi:hypothetical protein
MENNFGKKKTRTVDGYLCENLFPDLYEYEELISRIYSSLEPSNEEDTLPLKLPVPKAVRETVRTLLLNFGDFCTK